MRRPDPHLSDRELVAKLDREVTAPRAAAINAHLAGCDTCQARARELRSAAMAVRIMVRSSRDDDWQAQARQNLAAALDRDASRMSQSDWTWWRLGASLTPAAAVVLVALAVSAFVLVSQLPGPPSASKVESASVSRVLPIARLTPGATSSLTAAQLCAGQRPSRVVVADVARRVLRDYGMEHVPADEYELDALITPELGGTTAEQNLWPQRYSGDVWTAHVKDDIENYLGELVCKGQIDLRTAQREIATDWIAAYQHHFHRDRPMRTASDRTDEPELLMAARAPGVASGFRVILAVERSPLN